MTNRFISALEPMFVAGIVIAIALVGLPSLNTVISRGVHPLESVSQAPDEVDTVALGNDESRPDAKR